MRSLLTAEQMRRLPTFITPFLDGRYLASVRSGSAGTGLGMIMRRGWRRHGDADGSAGGGGGAQIIIRTARPDLESFIVHHPTPHMRKLLPLSPRRRATRRATAAAPAVRLINAPEASSKPVLGNAVAARQLPNGNVVVNDITKRQLVMFDPTLGTTTIIADSVSGGANSYGPAAGALTAFFGDHCSSSIRVICRCS